MRSDLFDFELPPDRIALRPASPRDAARLLAVHPGSKPELEDARIGDLPDRLRSGDALVVNETRVIPARLNGRRLGPGGEGPRIEATLISRLDGSRAKRSKRSVTPESALTTMIGSRGTARRTTATAFANAAALPTEVPPNLRTIKGTLRWRPTAGGAILRHPRPGAPPRRRVCDVPPTSKPCASPRPRLEV